MKWATGEGSFVVVGLIETLSGTEQEDLIDRLRKNRKLLEVASGKNKGSNLILQKIS